MAVDNHIFLKIGSDLFSREPLERGDHVEAVREIGVFAQAIFGFEAPANIAMARTDLPDGQSLTLVIPGQPAGLSPESITTGRSCLGAPRRSFQTINGHRFSDVQLHIMARASRASE